jgi:DNA helicase HerA-like ATPase
MTGDAGKPGPRLMQSESAPQSQQGTIVPLHERREPSPNRVLGHLVSLTGLQGIIASKMNVPGGGEHWSIGHLITVVHGTTRLVGVVCEIATLNSQWDEEAINMAHVKIELNGEIVDEAPGKPVFYRGIRSFPALGAIAHRIRAADLKAIYSFRGGESVEIGSLTQNAAIPASVSIQELVTRHFAVVGSTGVGKTTSVSMLLRKCLENRKNLRILILDPHNEYKRHFPDNAIALDSDNLELPFWMFRFEEMVDIIYSGKKANTDEIEALYEVIKSAKGRFSMVAAPQAGAPASALRRPIAVEGGSISADTPIPYRVSDALAIIDEWSGKLDQRYPRSDLRALKQRLETLSRDPRYRFMFGKFTVDDNITKILGRIFRVPTMGAPVTVVQMAGLPNEVVNAVVSVLARMAFEIAMWSGGGYEIAVVCEEAHRYIPSDQSQAFGPTRAAIGRIAKEGRKYGVSLGVVTQRPSELDATVLSQCSTMFAMRLANENDKAIVRGAVGASSAGAINFLSSIADREAIAFGEAIPTPMRMKFADYRDVNAAAPAIAPQADPFELRRIIARLRGEYSSEAQELK